MDLYVAIYFNVVHFLIISLCSIGYFFCCSVLFTYCVILPINTPVCIVEFSSHIILCLIVKLQTRAPLPRNSEISHTQYINYMVNTMPIGGM